MCEDAEEFSTVVGRRHDVIRLQETWDDLVPYGLRELARRPEHLDLAHLHGTSARFMDDNSPAVAVIYHPAGRGVRLSAVLQGAVLAGHVQHGAEPLPSLLIEPGFAFRAASGPAR